MLQLTLILSCLALLVCVYLLFVNQSKNARIKNQLALEFRLNREELTANITLARKEILDATFSNRAVITDSFAKFKDVQNIEQIKLTDLLNSFSEKIDKKMMLMLETNHANSKLSRDEISNSLQLFKESFSKNVSEFNQLQREKFQEMALKQDVLVKSTENRLEKMRETVDEKLHKTLEDRLGQSFEIVNKQLISVQKGLGEMQQLANGVGDLKKVLSNVKTRGVLGEIQLGNILEQIMSPEQYQANVKTKKGSNDIVEYAVKLPGKNADKEVFLPIDAKFPQEDYLRLQQAYDIGDVAEIETQTKALVNAIKKAAKDIHQKYIDPPHTTDFGILFLPVEGIFAEVTRQPGLVEFLQREYKIVITGPTTLAAMLNSLQMGFRTLAIQKRSSEVWNVLSTVKKEFQTFGGVLEKTQTKLNQASADLEKLVGTRTRMMLSKLNKVEELEEKSNDLLES